MNVSEFTLQTNSGGGHERHGRVVKVTTHTNFTNFWHFFNHFSQGRKCATAAYIFSVSAKDHTLFKTYAM